MRYVLNTDADELLYTAAFSLEKVAYKIKTAKGEWDCGRRFTRQEIKDKLSKDGKVEHQDYEIITYKIPQGPDTFAIKILKNMLKRLKSVGDLRLFLTANDKSNFRNTVAKTPGPKGEGYKAGRPSRPMYYNVCRDYLLSQKATEVYGMEADDALGIYQSGNTVAVHQDKDINRIAGRHYNWKTLDRYIVTQPGSLGLKQTAFGAKKLVGIGNAWFFAQMLLGDRTDNIPACGKGMGDLKVYKLLMDCLTEQDYYAIVKEKYQQAYEDSWSAVMNEIADLVYIMDSEQIRGSEYLRRFE